MRMMFDLEEKGEAQLHRAVLQLPPNHTLTLVGTGVSIGARGGGGRRVFMITRQGRPVKVDISQLQAATTAVPALVAVHEAIREEEGEQ